MSHYEATSILRSSKDKIQLRVAENIASKSASLGGLYLEQPSSIKNVYANCDITLHFFCRIHCYQRPV